MRRSKRSKDGGHDAAALGTGHWKEGKPRKTKQKKIANKIITYRRRDIIYAEVDLHRKNARIATVVERGKILMLSDGPHTQVLPPDIAKNTHSPQTYILSHASDFYGFSGPVTCTGRMPG